MESARAQAIRRLPLFEEQRSGQAARRGISQDLFPGLRLRRHPFLLLRLLFRIPALRLFLPAQRPFRPPRAHPRRLARRPLLPGHARSHGPRRPDGKPVFRASLPSPVPAAPGGMALKTLAAPTAFRSPFGAEGCLYTVFFRTERGGGHSQSSDSSSLSTGTARVAPLSPLKAEVSSRITQ